MNRNTNRILSLALTLLASLALALPQSASAQQFTTLDDPLGVGNLGTTAFGISGNKIVGTYYDSNGAAHGFVYDGKTYTTLDDPLALATYGTSASGISGDKIVGWYFSYSSVPTTHITNQGFVYDLKP